MAATICRLGNPVLRRTAAAVHVVPRNAAARRKQKRPIVANQTAAGEAAQELPPAVVARMHAAMTELGGVGIAAPQIGSSVQAVLVGLPPDVAEVGCKPFPTRLMINPQLRAVCEDGSRMPLPLLSEGASPVAPGSVETEPEVLLPRITPHHSHGAETVPCVESCLSVPGLWGTVWRFKHSECDFEDEHGVRWRMTASGLVSCVLQHEIDHLYGVLFVDRAERTSLRFDDENERFHAHDMGTLEGNWELEKLD